MSDEADSGPPPPPPPPPAEDSPPPDHGAAPGADDADPPPDQSPRGGHQGDDGWDDHRRGSGLQPPSPEGFDWERQRDRKAATDYEYEQVGVRADRIRMYAVQADGLAAGRDIHVHQAAAAPTATTGALAEDWVIETMRSYQPSPSYAAIEGIARRHHLVLLTGADGSGRFCTAVYLAGALCGVDKIVSVDVSPEGAFSTAFDRPEVLREEHAHIVMVSGAQSLTRQSLLIVADKARAARSYVIVIGAPDRQVDPGLLPFAAHHECPPADRLLRHFLRQRLLKDDAVCVGDCDLCGKACAGPFIERCCADPDVRAHLERGQLPAEVDDLAGRLLTAQYRGEPLSSAIGLTYGHIRRIAETVLGRPTTDPVRPSETRHLLRTLSFRVAYATLHDSALNVVFFAARLLYEELSAEYRPDQSAPATPPFDGKLTDFLHPDMIANPAAGSGADDDRPRLIDPKLLTAMLDVLWNKYDRLRAPLMRWVFHLGRHPLDPVRRRAASVCGQFARWDTFDAYNGLIKKWALADGWAARHTAAYAMANLAVDPTLTAWVRRQVRDWINARGTKYHDSAARAYAEIRDCPFVEDILPNLQQVAAEPDLSASFAVPKAVAALVEQQPASLSAVVAALATWPDGKVRGQTVQAARSVLFMSTERAAEPDERWPVLVRAAHKDEKTLEQLVGLWRVALTEVLTANHAWAALLAWHLQADGVPELEDVMVRFHTGLCGVPQLRVRAEFHVRRWRNLFPDAGILRRIPPFPPDSKGPR